MMKNCEGCGILMKKERERGIRIPLPDPLLLVTLNYCNIEIWLVVLFSSPILTGWEKDAI